MFKRILVPLDGSELAEQALETVQALAEKFGSEVLLVRAGATEERNSGPPVAIQANINLHETQMGAEAYLDTIKSRLLDASYSVRTVVLSGAAPVVIVAIAREQAADLIVMSTHGHSGFNRLIYGSVAEAVLRGSHIPVLLIPNKI